MKTAIEIETLTDLQVANDGSFYTIRGAGGDLNDWVNGYSDLMEKAKIGRPTRWYQASGAAVNYYAAKEHGQTLDARDEFQADLTILMFPLEGLHVGKLAMFKLQMEDSWFDDVIANMDPARR